MDRDEMRFRAALAILAVIIKEDHQEWNSWSEIDEAVRYADWLLKKLDEKVTESKPQVLHYIAKVLTTTPGGQIHTIGCGKCFTENELPAISLRFTCKSCGIEHYYCHVKGYYEATEYLPLEED